MDKLVNVVKSLLDQTVRVDLISVIISDKEKYKLPKNLKNSISLFKCGQNNGILNCLIPTITRESESTTQIITLGSQQIYGKDFIETLLEKSEKFPNDIIYKNNKNNKIELTKGVVFKTNFFNEDFFNIPKNISGSEWINKYFKDFPKKRIEYNENYRKL